MADSSNVAADIADLKTLISQIPIALYVCESPSGLIRLYNRRAAELWGHEPTLGEQGIVARFGCSARTGATCPTPKHPWRRWCFDAHRLKPTLEAAIQRLG